MATVSERAIAAMIGGMVGDAAAQPIHWIYDLGKLKAILAAAEHPEFRSPSANPFYRIDTGRNTCYGDQSLALLESLVRCRGLDAKDYARTQYQYFGPETEYENKSNAAFVLKSGLQKNFPIHGPWRNQVIKDFLARYQAAAEQWRDQEGAESHLDLINCGGDRMKDMHAVVQVVPIVALYAGRPEMLQKVEEAVSVTMTADEAIVHSLVAARIVEHFVLHGSEGDVLDSVLAQLRDPGRNQPYSLDQAVVSFLLKVKENLSTDHFQAATEVFRNN